MIGAVILMLFGMAVLVGGLLLKVDPQIRADIEARAKIAELKRVRDRARRAGW